jgi:3-dehydroquinate dehydratase
MLTDEELMQRIEHFGRWNVQKFVVKSQDMGDVLTYLRAERSLELAKVMAFVTSDLVRFEREEALPPCR